MKYEITDQFSQATVYFTVEGEDGKVYKLTLQENDWWDHWQVTDEAGDEIEDEALRNELIDLCDKQLEAGE